MMFWIVAGTLSALVAALLARPLLAPPSAEGAEAKPDMGIYRDQLAEVERDLARGVLAPEEAERARTEIARRLLAADRAGPLSLRQAPRPVALATAALTGLVVVMGSLVLYASLGQPAARDDPRAARLAEAARAMESRPSQSEAEARFAEVRPLPPPDLPENELALIEELRRVVPTRPDEPEGWELLAQQEARLGDYAAAARAQERLVAIKGDDATVEDLETLVDLLVEATGGVLVSPEAEAVLRRIEALAPRNSALHYYQGLLLATTGRPDLAFPYWRAVVEGSDAPDWRRERAVRQIEELAWLAGVDYELPSSGPSAEDVAAAGSMDPEAQRQMIQGMVDGLRERLTAEGGSPEEWAQLVNALMVLGDAEGAREVLAQGRAALGGNAEGAAILEAVARNTGLAP